MSTEENKDLIRRLVAAVNGGDATAIEALLAPDYVDHSVTPGAPADREDYLRFITGFRQAFPDAHWTIEDLIAEGDRAVVRVTFRGTHQGELMGMAPTGKTASIEGIGIYRVAGGKIAEAWVQRDSLGLLQQLGAIPAPGQPATD